MRKSNFITLLTLSTIVLLATVSCTQSQSKNNIPSINIDINKAKPLKEAVSSINVIMLQDSSSAHFPGDLTKVVWTNDSIFILDTWKDPGIYLYNTDGVLTNSYTKAGNGPDEFAGITDFNITPSNIILLDTYSASKKIYLDRNFTFQHKEESEGEANHFFTEEKHNGGVWYDRGNVAYGTNKDKLIYYTHDKKRKAVLPIPQELENITFASPNVFTPISNDTILYLPAVEPHIYKCFNGQAEVFCELNFKDLWPDFTTGAKNGNPLDLMRRISKDGKIYSTNMLSDGHNIAFTFFCKEVFYILMFNYNDLSAYQLLKVDKHTSESLGALVAMTDGCLIFGEPGKLLKLKIE